MTNQIKMLRVPSYDAIEEALQTLDAIHSSGRLNYNDYCELYDAITNIEEHSYYKNAIDRQEAIIAINALPRVNIDKLEPSDVENVLTELPPVSTEQWIPCEKDLPKEEQEVLMVTKYKFYYTGYYHESDKEWFSDGSKIKNVIAWMPLPEAYSGD